MRILIVTPLYPTSGKAKRTEKSFAVHNFVKYWTASHDVQVVNTVSFGLKEFYKLFSANRRFSLEGVPGKQVSLLTVDFLKMKFFSAAVRAARGYLKKRGFSPDVIVSHCASGHLLARRLNSKFYRVPHVCGIHKADISKLSKGEGDYINCFTEADLIACRSASIERRFKELLPEPVIKAPVYVTSSGVNKEFIETEQFITEKREAAGPPFRIVTVASLIPRKKIDSILRVLHTFRENNWEYRIVGDGKETRHLRTLVTELGLEERVHFTGYLEHDRVAELLKQSDLFVLVSERETFGLVYLEAMAKGCVVVGSRNWGIDGIVKHGENGFLCEPGDEQELRQVLAGIFAFSQAEWKHYIQASYSTACAYEEQRVADDYLSQIVNVVHDGKAAR